MTDDFLQYARQKNKQHDNPPTMKSFEEMLQECDMKQEDLPRNLFFAMKGVHEGALRYERAMRLPPDQVAQYLQQETDYFPERMREYELEYRKIHPTEYL